GRVERGVDQALNGFGARADLAGGRALRRACPMQLVGDVHRDNHGHAQRLGIGEIIRREVHFRVDVGSELRDVARIELAPDRVLLSVDLDVDDAGFHSPSLSMTAIISVTRWRMRSRSSRMAAMSDVAVAASPSRDFT